MTSELSPGRAGVWGAVDHARGLGFESHAEVEPAGSHPGQPWQETSATTFGRDGVPFDVSGRHGNPNTTLRTLARSVGKDAADHPAAAGR